ncbi:hypothetical protein ANN_02622 [Periplaneta americana]|uniref:Uncharacterized protein n=1 Tax=Periplaneta americana TaxID=6978 RepID=A0ABQ8TWW6_PERAM|nr:hypothetical protein ANN_02622 [Periplaneta americana]
MCRTAAAILPFTMPPSTVTTAAARMNVDVADRNKNAMTALVEKVGGVRKGSKGVALRSYSSAGEWRKLHNAELHALYSSPDIIRNIKSRLLRWAGHVARMGKSRNAYRVLVGRPEGKRPLGRPRRGWEDNIKMDLREVGYDDRDWINLAQDRDQLRAYVRAAMNLRLDWELHAHCWLQGSGAIAAGTRSVYQYSGREGLLSAPSGCLDRERGHRASLAVPWSIGPQRQSHKYCTGMSYYDMLTEWLFPQLEEEGNEFLFQKDGAPPHWHFDVRNVLNQQLEGRWIGSAGNQDYCVNINVNINAQLGVRPQREKHWRRGVRSGAVDWTSA